MITPIVISEKININSREQLGNIVAPQVQGFAAARNNSILRYSVIRNPVDDTFNLEFSRQLNVTTNHDLDEYMTLPYVNVNNLIEFYGYNSPISRQIMSTSQSQEWKVHRTLLKEAQLRKTSTIVMGEDLFRFQGQRYETPGSHGVIYRNINFLTFDEVEKNAIASFEDVIELDSISRINFARVTSPTVRFENVHTITESTSFNEITTRAEFQYSRLFIKPISPNFFRGDQDVAEIYGYSNEKTDWVSQFSIKNASLKSTSLKSSKLNLAFEKYSGQTKSIVVGDYQPKLLGKLKITDPTYYDYNLGETKVGFAPHSIIGEVIPYSFKGDYTRELDLDFNGVFKDMKLAFTKRINQPVLSPTNGLVRLSIYPNQNRPTNFLGHFTPEDIKLIKDNKLDLNGLMRLSNHEG